jgi:hypothetical protein
MSTHMRRKSLTTVEEVVVEHALGTIARTSTLSRIQRLTTERQHLYAQSAAHPFLARTNARRIQQIGAEVEFLWDVLRRERAQQRVRIERALNIEIEVDPDADRHSDNGSIDAA